MKLNSKKGQVGVSGYRVTAVPLALALVAPSGCALGTPFHGQVSAAPSPVLELSWARATRAQDGVVVLGQVKQVNCCAHTISGHIHLEAKDRRGQTLAATNAVWGDFIARQLHAASFKALLAVPRSAAVDRVEIEFKTKAPG